MKTRYEQMTAGGLDSYANFGGDDSEYREWLAAPLGRSRDSGIMENVNFEAGLKMLGGKSDTVRVERYGHWACGWIEQVYVKPGTPAEIEAGKIEAALADYPLLDESAYFEAVNAAAVEYFAQLSTAEKVQYCQQAKESIFAARATDYHEFYHRAPGAAERIENSVTE